MAPRPIVGPERTGHWGDLHRSREFYVYTYGLVGKQAWGFARLCFVLIFFGKEYYNISRIVIVRIGDDCKSTQSHYYA